MPVIASTPVNRMDGPYPRRWWALLVLCLSLLLIVMANTSLIVAAPDMTRDLDLSNSDLQWVIDGYTVPYAALMLLLGAVGDRYSRRGALLVGLLIFGGGSVAGSLVHSTEAVIAARAVMGVGAAVIMPATLSLLVATFPRDERARAITAWTATSGLAIALGPLFAGWLLERHAWGSTFLINVPVVVAAMAGAMLLVPPSRAEHRGRTDLTGGLLSIVSLGALVYMIIEGPNFGWGATAITAAVVSVIGLACFALWELRHPNPLLDVRKFRGRPFAGSVLAVLFFFLGTFGAIYYATQHLQFVLGYTPLETGLRLLPLAGAVFAGAVLTGWMTPVLGMKTTVVTGMVLGTAALYLLVRISDGSTYSDFLAPLVLLGAAIGLSTAPCADTIMGSFPEERLGVGGGVNDTSIEFGGSLGIAILGSVLGTTYTSRFADAVGDRLPPEALGPAEESVGGALLVAKRIAENPAGGPQEAGLLVQAAHRAFSDAVSHTSLVGGAILSAGTLLVAFVLPGRKRGGTGRHSAARGEDRPPEPNAGEPPETAHDPGPQRNPDPDTGKGTA